MTLASQIEVCGKAGVDGDRILTTEALAFVAELDNRFACARQEVLVERARRAEEIEAGWTPDFLPETAQIRDDPSWRVAPAAPGLVDRRVEITGPPDRKMTVNALNSGAQVWLADFEDANAPLWSNMIQGQANLLDALTGRLDFVDGAKRYAVGPDPATIVVRPRGWHLVDKHVVIDGRPVSASILDFALYLFHCGARQIERGQGPYFYLPKIEHATEARLWNDIFVAAQDLLGLPQGTIRATVLIETIHAAFEMEEILFELQDHCAGLNAGRWDYLFSIIKAFSTRGSDFVLPDRAAVTMSAPFMRAYAQLLVQTCHRRGAHAIGGMSAFIPSSDRALNAVAFGQVRADKQREAGDGFDGSWVAHPGLVDVCREVFDGTLGSSPNQIDRPTDDAEVSAQDLLAVAKTPGDVTVDGVRANIGVALRYLDAWLRGSGAVAINGLMEDVATAEIARCQVWQWLHNDIALPDGHTIDRALVGQLVDDEMAAAQAELGTSRLDDARTIFTAVACEDTLPPFLTTWAYPRYMVRR